MTKNEEHVMRYVDGYVLPVPKKNLNAYRRMAAAAGKIWREHGAIEYFECTGDDLHPGVGMPFPKLMKLKPREIPIFSWIVFKSRAHRDRVNARVMADPRINESMGKAKKMPFDVHRMTYGGFKVLVEA
jgi:uncharacterized protein YbaA (DUF1428 family)